MRVKVLQRLTEQDAESVDDVLRAAAEHDGHTSLSEHKRMELDHGGPSRTRFVLAWQSGHDHAVGYGHLSHLGSSPPEWGAEIVVHPQHRGIGFELALAQAALAEASRQGGGRLTLWAMDATDTHEALAHRLGLRRSRALLQMRRPLPHPDTPVWPEGVHVRAFVPGSDEQEWLEVNERAFAGHPEQGRWDMQTLLRRMAEPWFDPRGFLLARDERGMAGFCWTKVHEAPRIGEIYVIAVDPDRAGRRLGSTLVLAGMQVLSERGLPAVMLYVDADNAPAVSMYGRLGFVVHHTDRAYVTDVPTGAGT